MQVSKRILWRALVGVACIGLPSGVASSVNALRPDSFATINAFVTTWKLPIELADAAKRGRRPSVTDPEIGLIRIYLLDRAEFGISARGHVVHFRAPSDWHAICLWRELPEDATHRIKTLLGAAQVVSDADVLANEPGSPRSSDRHSGGRSFRLRAQPRSTERVSYRNSVRVELDQGGCLRELAATDLQGEVPAVTKISAERALALANDELQQNRMRAHAVSLELKFYRGRRRLMWIPSDVSFDGDIDVASPIWIDANSGRVCQTHRVPNRHWWRTLLRAALQRAKRTHLLGTSWGEYRC